MQPYIILIKEGVYMIVLERSMPEKMVFLEVVLRRGILENELFEKLYANYQLIKSGYWGENRVDKEWKDINIPQKHYLMHNYESQTQWGHSHQIDTMFLCVHFILLIEVKNIAGRLDFEYEKHQLIRTKQDGIKEGFANPIDQIERHVTFVQNIINYLGINIPIIPAIISANPSTIIGTVPPNFLIFHATGLNTKVNQLFNKFSKTSINDNQLELLKEELLRRYKKKVTTKMELDIPFVNGALCKRCQSPIQMEHQKIYFICPNCKFYQKSKDAIIENLRDYKILYDEWITNAEFRTFFNIRSQQTVYKMINRLKMKAEGNGKARKYRIHDFDNEVEKNFLDSITKNR